MKEGGYEVASKALDRIVELEAEKQGLEQAIADLAISQRETLLALRAEQERLDWLISKSEWTAEQRRKGPRVVIDEMRWKG